MTRNRASAKKAGTAFETLVVGYLRNVLHDERIERRAKSGAKDRGDVSGVRTATNPPFDAKVLEKLPITRSTSPNMP